MKFGTMSIEFSFDGLIYRQIDGVSMISPLGPILANIFVGLHEESVLSKSNKPDVYFRYVDDPFCHFDNKIEADHLLSSLNNTHPTLKFTQEKEIDSSLPFLDVLVSRSSLGLLTFVYRKPTFTSLYTRWDSFCPVKRKINLIKTLIYRALMICSKAKLDDELKFITTTLCKNAYPLNIVESIIKNKIAEFNKVKPASVQRCPMYLHLPWLGNINDRYAKRVSLADRHCYFAVNTRVVFSAKPVLPSMRKDVLPPHHNSSLIYSFKCSCVSHYKERTTKRLDVSNTSQQTSAILSILLQTF